MKRASWRTTIAGIVTCVLGVALTVVMLLREEGFHPETSVIAGGMISVGIGLLQARDNRVSSEQAGVKK